MNAILTLLKIAGSLGLFLYGMKILSDGLQKCAGSRMKNILQLMTGNHFKSVLTGLLITIIIQSSSATTVMVVSFVNASLLTLVQAIGVILGANIGTTITGWIVAILGFKMDITVLSLVSIAIALPFLFSKKTRQREGSEIFLGFGLLFLGLNYLQTSIPDISKHTALLSFLSRFDNGSFFSIVFCVFIGMVLTIIVQSSSATMAITITMAYQGWIGVYTASALCLGQNIGTTITAYIASIGASTNARRAAWAHILFNVIGTIIAIIFFNPLLEVVNRITPGDIHSMDQAAKMASLPTFLAAFHTLFNLVNTILFFPFITPFAKLIDKLVPDKKVYDEGTYHFTYIGSSRMDTPEIYLLTIRDEITKMAKLSSDMFRQYTTTFDGENFDIEAEVKSLKEKEEYADQMQEQLTSFCVHLLQDSQTPTNAASLTCLVRVIDELESITDSVFNLVKLTEQRKSEGFHYNEKEAEELSSFNALVQTFLDFICSKMNTTLTSEEMEEANDLEATINTVHEELAAAIRNRLADGSQDVRLELIMLEIERNLEHIGDYCINIAESYHQAKKHTPILQRTEQKTVTA